MSRIGVFHLSQSRSDCLKIRFLVFSNSVVHKMKEKSKDAIRQGHIKKRKLKEEHKAFINDLILSNPFSQWTWNKVKSKLNDEFLDMPQLHNSTISKWMSNQLNLSYKKLELRRPPASTQTSYRKWLESALLQIELMRKDVEIIYIDEFHVNTRLHRFRGWTQKGQKGYITVDLKDFSMSFFWALSYKRVYGLMGKEDTNKSEIVKYYLKNLYEDLIRTDKNQANRTIVIWDNAPVHSSNATTEFIKSAKLRVFLRSPVYSIPKSSWETDKLD